jgi:rifampicin phosphotransferase
MKNKSPHVHLTPEEREPLGGKAFHLTELRRLGYRVPEFVVIPATRLPQNTFTLPDDIWEEVLQQLPQAPYYAVRSSAQNEDGTHASFAGLFETLLYQPLSNLRSAIEQVWKSIHGERVAVYLQQQHLPTTMGGMAIIIQRMIDPDVSGVAFGINPLTGNHSEKVINATPGLGEGLVSGQLNADMFVVTDTKIITTIADKERKITLNTHKGKGTHTVNIPPEEAQLPCLNDAQIKEICDHLNTLEKAFGMPQDIEFAYQNDLLYLLQTRPVTTTQTHNTSPPVTIWDNSNIIESYPGITSPLTFSFILKMYEAVYRQLSVILGVSPAIVEQHQEVYANMLGHLWGRVYYNLNHWHQTLSLLPGYSINATFMDHMMGVKESFDTSKIPKQQQWKAWYHVAQALIKMAYTHARINKDRIAFQSYFQTVMTTYQNYDFTKMSLHELHILYLEFEQTLVKKWKAPLVNDFFCMIYFGLLQKLVVKYQLDENGSLHNDLISGAKDIVSTEPIRLTTAIAQQIINHPRALACFTEKQPIDILKECQEPDFSEIQQSIQHYISQWGERCVGELKLETITYKQAPERYIAILQSYVKNGISANTTPHHNIREQAEQHVHHALKGKWWKKKVFMYVLKKARYLVSHRENLRYERTRGFGMVRIMMNAMGTKLEQAGSIDKAEDIFYLEQQEVFNYIKGTSSDVELKGLISLRKKSFEAYSRVELPERIRTTGPVYLHPLTEEPEEHKHSEKVLTGIGCSAGIVRGVAQVVLSPHESDGLNGRILVTASTDPGWVVLFPGASAILVERGSLLSHSAIVSREMGIPCVVGVKHLLKHINTGDILEMDGTKGTIHILKKNDQSN